MEVVNLKKDSLIIANKKFNSRLIVGTGKYKSMSECAKAIKLSGAEIVTVAVRRVNISDKNNYPWSLTNLEGLIEVLCQVNNDSVWES